MATSASICSSLALCRLHSSISFRSSSTIHSSASHLTRRTMANPHTAPLSTTTRYSMEAATPVQTAPFNTTVPATPSPEKISAFDPHFLVISLGNPPPHGEGLHSAGHHALQSLQKQLYNNHAQPQFSSQRIAKKAAQISRGPKYTLVQCPTLMNISGPWIAKAWKEALTEANTTQTPLGLVVVHDDLEQDICVIKTRKWDTSHRGHNGLKSIMASMRPADFKESRWAKIRIGIGRPEGRDHDTVSEYVLKPMSRYRKDLLSNKSGGPVLAALKEIEAAWVSELKNSNMPQETEKPAKMAKKGKKRGQAE